MWHARRTSSGTWATSKVWVGDANDSDIAIDLDGSPHIVWSRSRGGITWATDAGGTWTTGAIVGGATYSPHRRRHGRGQPRGLPRQGQRRWRLLRHRCRGLVVHATTGVHLEHDEYRCWTRRSRRDDLGTERRGPQARTTDRRHLDHSRGHTGHPQRDLSVYRSARGRPRGHDLRRVRGDDEFQDLQALSRNRARFRTSSSSGSSARVGHRR